MQRARQESETSFRGMRTAAVVSLAAVEHVLQGRLFQIRAEVGEHSEEARDLLGLAHEDAAEAVKRREEETGDFTEANTQFVNGELRKALAIYGIEADKQVESSQARTP